MPARFVHKPFPGRTKVGLPALCEGVKDPTEAADLLLEHPAVRRMLLTQKAFVEGGRSMLYDCGIDYDLLVEARLAGDFALERRIDDRMGFVTPILKGFLTEVGSEVANLGVQVLGGHGYIKANAVEQILRDIRISTLWEGTTQIQGLDLLGRKVLLQKLKPIHRECGQLALFAWRTLMRGKGKRVRRHALTVLYKSAEWLLLTYRVALCAARHRDAVGAASVEYLLYAGVVRSPQRL